MSGPAPERARPPVSRREAHERPLGVYLHIPFCVQKCAYCHFAIDPGRPGDSRRERYLRALTAEIGGSKGGVADSIYFGGGTPSLVPPAEIDALIVTLKSRYTLAADTEVTLEANPRDLAQRGYSDLLAAGVNRLSLGVQSFDDTVLREMFRDHTGDDAVSAVRAARAAGFANLSMGSSPGFRASACSRPLHQAGPAAVP